jgi:transposase
MRGDVKKQSTMFSLMGPAQRVPKDHPIRRIKELADEELARLSSVFDEMYAGGGRPSIPPETLLKACLLIVLFSVRSERQFCERLDYDLMFRFFLDMGMDDASFDQSVFAKNKARLLEADVARLFFDGVVQRAREARLMSSEHFTVDGTLIEAWASVKSFKKKGEKDQKPPDDPGNPTVNFHGEKRSNETHESTTDPEAKLATKGNHQAAKPSFMAHVMMENRNGLCVDIEVTQASGYAEREAALEMLDRQRERGVRPRTLAADAGYDIEQFGCDVRARNVTPHIAWNRDPRRKRHVVRERVTQGWAYKLSQRARKKVEEIFGWGKTVGGLRKTRYRGVERTGLWACITGAAYNLLRMSKLLPA